MLLSFVPVPAAFALVRHLSIPFARPLNDPPDLNDPPELTAARERDAEMAHQSESGRNRNERQEHDRKARSYEETTGNPYHLSKAARTVVGVLALIVVIALTALFVSGSIHW